MILKLEKIDTFYGMRHVLFGVSLGVDEGEVVALLGRNGAGKTTTMRSIVGLTPPRRGHIEYRGIEIARKPVHIVARMGIGYVPSDKRIFKKLTVRQNLQIAGKKGFYGGERWTIDKIYEIFPKLKDLDSRRGGLLSGGEQQMLSIARTLMGNPDLLLLDEPSTGLAPLIIRALGEQISKIKKEGLCVLLAEQNVKFGMDMSDRCYVIDRGEIKYSGTMEELKDQREILQTYLAV
jgi:branched-chain amino acid transport system ATP-binding protein